MLVSGKLNRKMFCINNQWANITCVTLDHKTSPKCQFFFIKIYTSSKSGINKLSIDLWFVMIGYNLAEMQLF